MHGNRIITIILFFNLLFIFINKKPKKNKKENENDSIFL